jgi:hypothetical protein
MQTKRRRGKIYMNVAKSSGSIIRKPFHKTVHARIGRKTISVACVVLRSGPTITLRALTSSATPEGHRGERTIAKSQKQIR